MKTSRANSISMVYLKAIKRKPSQDDLRKYLKPRVLCLYWRILITYHKNWKQEQLQISRTVTKEWNLGGRNCKGDKKKSTKLIHHSNDPMNLQVSIKRESYSNLDESKRDLGKEREREISISLDLRGRERRSLSLSFRTPLRWSLLI